MTENLVTLDALQRVGHEIGAHLMRIVHPSTANATHVAVAVRIPVEACLCGADLMFLDDPGLDQELQIAVHRPETDPGQPTPGDLIELDCRGMRCQPLQLLQDDVTLTGVPLKRLYLQHGPTQRECESSQSWLLTPRPGCMVWGAPPAPSAILPSGLGLEPIP